MEASPQMKEITVSAFVDAPQARVFGAVADPRKPFLTSNRITRMEIVGKRTSGVGTVYRWFFTLPFGIRFQFDEVVTDWLEPERFAYRAISAWQMEAVTALSPESGGTRVAFTLRCRFPGVWHWLIPKWVMRRGARRAIANLRGMVQ